MLIYISLNYFRYMTSTKTQNVELGLWTWYKITEAIIFIPWIYSSYLSYLEYVYKTSCNNFRLVKERNPLFVGWVRLISFWIWRSIFYFIGVFLRESYKTLSYWFLLHKIHFLPQGHGTKQEHNGSKTESIFYFGFLIYFFGERIFERSN